MIKTRKIFIAFVFILCMFGMFTLTSPVKADVTKTCLTRGDYFGDGKQIIVSDDPELKYTNILTEASVEFLSPDSEKLDETQPIPNNSKFIATINFVLDDCIRGEMEAEDYFEFTIQDPEAIKFSESLKLDLIGEDEEGIEVTFATLSITEDGNIRITFTDAVEKMHEIKGYFNINGIVDVGEDGEPGGIDFRIPTRDEFTIELDVKTESNSLIKKVGILDSENNPNAIKWEVFVNQSYQSLTNAIVTDTIPDELTFDSVEVYTVKFNTEGNLIEGSEELLSADKYTLDTTGAPTIKVGLKNITSPYKIVYQTTINGADALDMETFDVTNKATLSATEIEDISSSATITAPYDKFIDKEAIDYDRAEGIITWQVIYNAREASLPSGTTATDVYDSKLEYVDKSMKITDGSTPFDFSVVNTPADPPDNPNPKLDITFNEAIDGKLIITYETKIKADEINEDSMIFKNTFTSEGVKGEGTKTIGQGNVSKEGEIVDYNNQLIDYTIVVNANKYTMNDLVIEDNYAFKGLETTTEPVIMDGSTKLIDEVDYKYVDRGVDGFTITMINDYKTFNTTLEITFTAKYTTDKIDDGQNGEDPDSQNNTVLRNKAIVTFKDHNDIERTSTTIKDIEPRNEVINNGKKDSSYNDEAKEITWRVFVNYNGYELKNASITDEITSNQKLVKGSLILKTFSVNSETGNITIDSGSEIDLETEDLDKSDYLGNKVLVNLPNGDKKYVLEFKTSLEGVFVLNEYINTAQFANEGAPTKSLTSKVNPTKGGKFVTKKATQDKTTINWEIDINLSRSTVFDAKITDTPTDNVFVDKNSFKLYPYVFVDGKRVLDRDNPLVKGADKDYIINWLDDGGFELLFNDKINEAYRLEYNTEINADKNDLVVKNKVIFTGNNEDYIADQDSEGSLIIDANLAGGATGVQSSLLITKYERDSDITITGARIQLINSRGKVVGEGVTDKNGEINFKKIVNGTYTLKEIEAAEGYHISEELHKGISVKVPNKEKDTDVDVSFRIENDPNKVIVTKLNISDEKLDDAEFKLEVKNEENVYVPYNDEIYTSKEGTFNITHLPLGEYRLIETLAPEGYILNTQSYEFVVEADKAGFVETGEIDVINYQGSVQLTKYAVNSDQEQSNLKGAIFELYKIGDQEDELISDDYSTDEFGIINVTDLAPGDYYFIEKSSSDGYIADKNPINFTIEAEFKGEPDLIELEAYNYKANVSFNKVDSYGNPLDNVVFELQKINSQSEMYEPIDTYTSIDGVVQVSNLSPGEYQFIEVETVEGFILNTGPIKFTISDSIMDQAELTITLDDFVNHQGKVAIEKRDVASNKLIDGAKFNLYTNEDKLVEKNITTMNGKIVIEKLAPGKYYIVETKAPSGYIKSEKQFDFEIVTEFAGQPEVETIKITNKEDVLPIVGVDYSAIVLLLITTSSLVGLRYYYRNN